MNKFISNRRVTILFWVAEILCFGLIAGCSKAPDGFPAVVPCVVTVTDNGVPVEGVFVQIETIPRTDSLSVVAQTNVQGKAIMYTYLGKFAKPGVPIGKLIMTLTKVPDAPHFKSVEEREKMTYNQIMAYDVEIQARLAKLPPIIPSALTDPQHSPLTLSTVSGNSVQWSVALEEYRKK